MNNESLDNLLNEQDIKEVFYIDPLKNEKNNNNNIIDIKTDSIKDEIDIESKVVPLAPTLVINDIDEVNLNLDELDNELGDDIDLDTLQTIDIKSNINEVKKEPNTKYIFFKDV